ncbi:hypothetical protein EDB80DRAFT_865646 [Ilyonectria destructans]|nr:hypothetical protein EDB80DRAFT_865646 [Ilyonectria destructans]
MNRLISDAVKVCSQGLLLVTRGHKRSSSHMEFSPQRYQDKAQVEEYAREVAVSASFFMPGFYMSNITGGLLRLNPQTGTWTLGMPVLQSTPIPVFNVADTGKWVKAMYMTPAEIVEDFKETYPVVGSTASFFEMPHSVFLEVLTATGMPEFGTQGTLENFLLMNEGGYFGGQSLDESLALLEDAPTTWVEFMKQSPPIKELS